MCGSPSPHIISNCSRSAAALSRLHHCTHVVVLGHRLPGPMLEEVEGIGVGGDDVAVTIQVLCVGE